MAIYLIYYKRSNRDPKAGCFDGLWLGGFAHLGVEEVSQGVAMLHHHKVTCVKLAEIGIQKTVQGERINYPIISGSHRANRD